MGAFSAHASVTQRLIVAVAIALLASFQIGFHVSMLNIPTLFVPCGALAHLEVQAPPTANDASGLNDNLAVPRVRRYLPLFKFIQEVGPPAACIRATPF